MEADTDHVTSLPSENVATLIMCKNIYSMEQASWHSM